MNEKSIRNKYKNLTQLLISKNLSITTMESATSGQIASLITDTEGSSAIFKGAFITYSNEAKIRMGVPAEIIEKYSVYSKETAVAMAQAAQKSYNSNIAIGITGTMGNVDPANKKASVPGQVYFAIAFNDETFPFFYEIQPQKNRLAYKLEVADLIVKELLPLINK